MLDIAFIRDNATLLKKVADDKNVSVNVDRLLQLDKERRVLQVQFDELAAERKRIAAERKGPPTPEALAEGKRVKEALQEIEGQLKMVEKDYRTLLYTMPNVPTDDTPVGASEADNVVLRTVGEQPIFDFAPKEHFELGAALGVIDSERAAEVAGSRFTYLKGELVWLQFALVQHALNTLGDEAALQKIASDAGLTVDTVPFQPVVPPVMVRSDVLEKMARREPEDERYHLEEDNLFLVGSAEHALGPLHMNETLLEDSMPRRYMGYSSSFRREAGSYGKDVRGIYRLHQFDKIELESFTLPEQSLAEQDFIVAIQEHLVQSLGLHYQVVLKCTADMGTPDARAIDIETWMPGRGTYGETHTSDLMTDYQARRLRTKVKRADGQSEFVHMNDATVFAVGRTLIAIMENYQRRDGSVGVPDVLAPYVPFTEIKIPATT